MDAEHPSRTHPRNIQRGKEKQKESRDGKVEGKASSIGKYQEDGKGKHCHTRRSPCKQGLRIHPELARSDGNFSFLCFFEGGNITTHLHVQDFDNFQKGVFAAKSD